MDGTLQTIVSRKKRINKRGITMSYDCADVCNLVFEVMCESCSLIDECQKDEEDFNCENMCICLMNLRGKISHATPVPDISEVLLYQFNDIHKEFIDRKVAKIAEKKQADQEAIEEEMALEIL